MDLRRLRSFVVVAEELHFRRAARRLAITQPALSQHVAALEAEVAVRLLDRSRSHVRITEAGQVLLDGARRVLDDVDRLFEDTRRAGASPKQRVRIGYLEYSDPPFLAQTLRLLFEREPDIEVEPVELDSASVLDALADRSIDLGVSALPVERPDVVVRPFLESQWVVVVPPTHRFARKPKVPLAELAGERLVLFARRLNPPLHDWFLDQCRAVGFEPRIVYRTGQAHLGPRLARQGVGLFIAGTNVVRDLDQGVVAKPLVGLHPTIRFGVVWRAGDRSRPLRAFLQAMEAVVGKGRGAPKAVAGR